MLVVDEKMVAKTQIIICLKMTKKFLFTFKILLEGKLPRQRYLKWDFDGGRSLPTLHLCV